MESPVCVGGLYLCDLRDLRDLPYRPPDQRFVGAIYHIARILPAACAAPPSPIHWRGGWGKITRPHAYSRQFTSVGRPRGGTSPRPVGGTEGGCLLRALPYRPPAQQFVGAIYHIARDFGRPVWGVDTARPYTRPLCALCALCLCGESNPAAPHHAPTTVPGTLTGDRPRAATSPSNTAAAASAAQGRKLKAQT